MENQLTKNNQEEILTKQFEGQNVKIIIENGEPLFELYSTGMILGQVKQNSAGKLYPRKDRIDDNIKNAEIKPCVHNGHKYLTEEMLYDLMLEMKTDKVKPFRKWVTKEVLPTIRKTGGYINNAELMVNTYFNALDNTHKEIVKGLFVNIENQQKQIVNLEKENKLLAKDVSEWANESIINALVRRYGSSIHNFAQAWIIWKKNILYKYGININSRMTNYLNNTYKKTKPQTLSMLRNKEELTMGLKTAIAMCREENLEISDILGKHLNDDDFNDLIKENS